MKISALEFLNSLRNFEKQRNRNVFQDYSLTFLEEVLRNLGLDSPSQATRISIVGTNGKGSTAYFLSQLILYNGLGKVGLYVSPHLLTERERVQVNGKYFEYEELEEFLQLHLKMLEKLRLLSYFEFLTLFAIAYFQKHNCKFEIYEAGLGGRLDATKLAKADYVVLTKIGLDHTEILGDTKEKILEEKLHIATENCKALFYFSQYDNLEERIQGFCSKRKIQVYKFNHTLEDYLEFNLNYAVFILEKIVSSPILVSNTFTVPGRMEIVSEQPLIVYDVAHNPDALYFLISSLNKRYAQVRWNILLGCLPDKDIKSMLNILKTWDKALTISVLTSPPFAKLNFVHDVREVKDLENFTWNGALLVIGSFRLYEMLPKLKKSF